ncbi:hypothetical protein HWV62_16908 [Athelia sp. TMB]|nr:hypothetical protein HWV62_16908 [Athelia sp. TMB]
MHCFYGLPSCSTTPQFNTLLSSTSAEVNHLRLPRNTPTVASLRHIAALKAWHVAQGVAWQGGKRLQYVINGVDALAPDSACRAPRPPITTTMLSLLHQHLDLADTLDAVVFACACTAFWGQCRLGELLPTSISADNSNIPSRASLRHSRNQRARILRLPRTKTSRRGEDVALVSQLHGICPIAALNHHFQLNQLPSDSPLFAYLSNGSVTQLSRTKFLERCNAIWVAAGYPRSTGHSFRIGGTTELLLSGVPPDVVKALGRWSSDSFLRYWRSLEDIAPAYAANATRTRTPRKRRAA